MKIDYDSRNVKIPTVFVNGSNYKRLQENDSHEVKFTFPPNDDRLQGYFLHVPFTPLFQNGAILLIKNQDFPKESMFCIVVSSCKIKDDLYFELSWLMSAVDNAHPYALQ